jgi:copper chaperone CopZ
MEKLVLKLPDMYGDHRVIEVRRLITALPGVQSVYASAAWQRVEVEFDPAQTDAEAIRRALLAAGYGVEGDLPPPASPLVRALTDLPEAAIEPITEKVPAQAGDFGPCPGFEVRHPGAVHPADR